MQHGHEALPADAGVTAALVCHQRFSPGGMRSDFTITEYHEKYVVVLIGKMPSGTAQGPEERALESGVESFQGDTEAGVEH